MLLDCTNCKYELYDLSDYPCNCCRDDKLGTVVLTKWETDCSENVAQEIINFSPDLVNAVNNLKDECYSLEEITKAVIKIYKEKSK